MGFFGRRKSKAKATDAEPSYSPPEEDPPIVSTVTSEAASPDDDIDVAKVASIGSADPEIDAADEADETPKIVENVSILGKATTYISTALSMNTSTVGAEEETPYSEHNDDGEEKESKKDKIMDHITALWATALFFWFSLSKVIQVSLLAGAALGTVGVVALVAAGGQSPAFPAHINVAFVGNSYFYVNDLPRFVEQIADGHITQNSVIHNAASILQILMTGNGMWNKWATKKAMINGVKFDTYRSTTEYLYDMGACSVPQLLTGDDQMITIGNGLGTFIDDGQNPCFQQDAYREYEELTDLKHSWDYVVITDQSKTMAFDETREDALAAFNYTYGPILKKHRISPIIVQPHAYASSGANATGLDDLATFTALIMEGAQIYRKYINKRIGWFAQAHIAPVGNAFFAVYEESPNDLWPKLFLDDGIHPSAYGTFLYGCVIYTTMTGYMPKYKRVVVEDMENSEIFSKARRLQTSSSQAGFPTKDEAAILYEIAKKVTVKGYKPVALRGFKIEEGASDFLRTTSDNVYDGNYNGGQEYAQNYNVYNNMYNQASNNGYYNNNDYYQDNNDNANGNNNGNYNNNNNGYNYDNGNQQNDDNNGNGNYNYNNGNQQNDDNNGNGNYNYNNGNQQNDDNNGNGNYNYNNGNQQNDDNNGNGNYNYNNGNQQNYNNGNGNYDYNNGNQQNYNDNGNGNYNNNYNNDNQQNYNNNGQNNGNYGGGNQNSNQYYYYEDLQDDNVAN